MVEEKVHTTENLPTIGADFNTATLKRLSDAFEGLSPEAARTLSAFKTAADRVYKGYRPDRSANRLSLLNRLPSSEQMVALRAFEKAKEALLDVDSNGLGAQILVQTEKSFLDKKR